MRLLISFITISIFFACHTSQKAQSAPKPDAFVTWNTKKIDLGKVKKGERPSFSFEFTNVSNESIQIDIVDHCDCTEVDYTHKALAPGEKGRIDAIFKSSEKEVNEVVDITLIFKNMLPTGVPRIERVQYTYDLIK